MLFDDRHLILHEPATCARASITSASCTEKPVPSHAQSSETETRSATSARVNLVSTWDGASIRSLQDGRAAMRCRNVIDSTNYAFKSARLEPAPRGRIAHGSDALSRDPRALRLQDAFPSRPRLGRTLPRYWPSTIWPGARVAIPLSRLAMDKGIRRRPSTAVEHAALARQPLATRRSSTLADALRAGRRATAALERVAIAPTATSPTSSASRSSAVVATCR